MNIDIQKTIGNLLLKQISSLGATCRIMGGAARDWYFNKEANDIDCYIQSSVTIQEIIRALPDLRLNKTHTSQYESTNIAKVIKCSLYEMPIDLIFVQDLDKVFDDYDADICKIGYFVTAEHTDSSLVTPAFRDCIDTGIIKYNLLHLQDWQLKRVGERLVKLRNKFPDFKIEVV